MGKVPGAANEQLGLPGKELSPASGQMRSPRPAIPLPKSNACCLFWMAGSSLRPDEVQVLRAHGGLADMKSTRITLKAFVRLEVPWSRSLPFEAPERRSAAKVA